MSVSNIFTQQTGAELPLICGPMYPCSNPELVGAVSAAGGIGIVQPISLTYVHGHDYREGLRLINRLAGGRPVGFNALIEQSSKTYHDRMIKWVDIALEEGIRFFITSLGNPKWVVDRVHAAGGIVYHDVTLRKWAEKGRDAGVDGLVCVNNRAGGHLGPLDPRRLFDELSPLGLPLVSAGGVGSAKEFAEQMAIGYVAVQLGTRFIAATECTASESYKQAIVQAKESDITQTERLTGVPVAVINNAFVQKLGTKAGWFARWMLKGRKTKHWMRTIYGLRSIHRLKRDNAREGTGRDEYWQAGRSVATIDRVEPAATIVSRFRDAWHATLD
ncbi:MAG: nitronate monooxygenase [Gemmatimonadaceae bacterium]|nr:nitronate monooxygenase [Gemmatimonadaceae bacterium]